MDQTEDQISYLKDNSTNRKLMENLINRMDRVGGRIQCLEKEQCLEARELGYKNSDHENIAKHRKGKCRNSGTP